ncbi:hypothetical protein KSP40_PGU014420 [Platanthera guangdongensis]|uniref:Uncharacterized protein n=1 Tax=Platanthera guangdongensis TaxID=2320717 RepID=A0ABR2MX73_9ASPA
MSYGVSDLNQAAGCDLAEDVVGRQLKETIKSAVVWRLEWGMKKGRAMKRSKNLRRQKAVERAVSRAEMMKEKACRMKHKVLRIESAKYFSFEKAKRLPEHRLDPGRFVARTIESGGRSK